MLKFIVYSLKFKVSSEVESSKNLSLGSAASPLVQSHRLAASLVEVIGYAASLVEALGSAASPLVRRTIHFKSALYTLKAICATQNRHSSQIIASLE